jgi:hypothetical protein
MDDRLKRVVDEDLGPIRGCPDRALGLHVVQQTSPHSYATLPKLQHGKTRINWHHWIHAVVEGFRWNLEGT